MRKFYVVIEVEEAPGDNVLTMRDSVMSILSPWSARWELVTIGVDDSPIAKLVRQHVSGVRGKP